MNMTTRQATSFILIAAGLSAGVAQVLLLRELLTVAYGNELSMGVLLAAWLVCGALGSLVGRRLSRPGKPLTHTARTMILLATLPAPMLVVAVVCARGGLVIFSSIPELMSNALGESSAVSEFVIAHLGLIPGEALGIVHMALLGLLAAAGPAILDGMQFAVGCDLYGRSQSDRKDLGVAYALDAIGHLLGGVALASVIVLTMNPFAVACAAGAVNLLAALALGRACGGGRRLAAIEELVGAAVVIGALAIGSGHLHQRSIRWRLFDQEPLASIESIYGNLTITRQDPDGMYLYQSGVYSGASPPLVGTIDTLVHFAMLQHPAPKRVLMISGGVLGGLAEALKYEPELVRYVELDDKLFDLARKWASPEDVAALADPRVEAVQGDGRRVITSSARDETQGWDVILLCLPDPSTAQLNRFYTIEFYDRAKRALADGGVLAWEIPGAEGYFSPALLALHTCLRTTARQVFDEIVAMPGESAVCVASAGPQLTDDWAELESRLHRRGVQAGYFEALLPDLLDPWMLASVANTLDRAPPGSINRDMRPIGYFLDQAWWVTQFHPRSARWFGMLEGLRASHLLIPVGLLAVMLLEMSGLAPVRRGFVPLSVAITGLAAMAVEMALLLAFQAMYGYVYTMVGVIVGAFMIGVALASIATTAWLRDRDEARVRIAMVVTQTALALLAVGIAALLPWLWATSDWWAQSPVAALVLFPLATAVVGAVVGAQFPLATATWDEEGQSARSAAGLYAADLLGGAVGALVGGAMLAPVLGLPGTCHLAAGLSALMALLLATRVRL